MLQVRYTARLLSMDNPLQIRIASAALWLALIATTGCQTAAPRPDYETLAKSAERGEPVTADELRAAFLTAPDFDKRMQQLAPLEQQALAMMVDEPLRLGAVGSAILNVDYGSLTGHVSLVRFYQHVDATDTAAEHQVWVDRIAKSIERGGDGSRTKPYPVTSASEAQAFLKLRNLSQVGSMYHSGDTIPFMMLVAARPEHGAMQNIYFDLTPMYRAIEGTVLADEHDGQQSAQADRPFNAGMLIGYLARNDDSAAQAAIGAYLFSQNRYREAADWLGAASRTGNVLANLMLARVYQIEAKDLQGDARKQAMEFVLEQYLHAVAVGSDEAMFALAGLYLDGAYGDENVGSGLALLQQAAELGNPNALTWLGHLYHEGTVVPKDEAVALEYFKRAAATGDNRAQIQYVRYLLSREGTPFDPQAREWLAEDAKAGDAEAMLLLGTLYAKGVGVTQSYKQALTWFKSAVAASPDNVDIVNEVAWTLAVTHLEPLRKPAYALEIMEHAMNGDEEARKNPAFLDTWAAAYAANGNFSRAIELQQQAVQAAREQDESTVVEVLQEHLDAFQRGETVIDPVP